MKKKLILGLIGILLIIFFAGCKIAGKAWTPNGEQTVYNYLVGIKSDPSSYKVVIGEAADDSKEVPKAAELAAVLGVTESAMENEVSASDSYLIVIGSLTATGYSNGLFPIIVDDMGVPSEVISSFNLGIYDGIVLVRSPPTQLIIGAYNVNKLEVIIDYLKEYELFQTELSSNIILFQNNVPVDKCTNGIQDYDEGGVDCGGSCPACGAQPIQGTRTPPSSGYAGQSFSVSLSINIDENNPPPYMHVHEKIPTGCTVISTSPDRTIAPPNTLGWYYSNVYGYPPLTTDTTISYVLDCGSAGTYTFDGGYIGISASHGDDIVIPTNSITLTVLCTDNDGDGYGVCPNCGTDKGCTYSGNDCDDQDSSIYPGAAETACDNLDQDCSGADLCNCVDADDDGSYAYDAATCPNGDDCGDNDAATYPGASEQCDNKDNDCDDNIDEDVTRSCYSGPTGTDGVGICQAGTQTCSVGNWGSCAGEITPGAEVCDANDPPLNEDCDQDGANEDCACVAGETQSCGSQADNSACKGLDVTCTNGQWPACDYATLANYEADETSCDYLDNDCDGSVDEGCWVIWTDDNAGDKSLLDRIRAKTVISKGVVGDATDPSDSIGVIDIAGKLGVAETVLTSTITDYTNENLIIVGGPCANPVAAELMGKPWVGGAAAADCADGFTPNKGSIIIRESEGKVQLLVAGYSALDTRRTARAIARYTEETIKSGMKNERRVRIVGTQLADVNIENWS